MTISNFCPGVWNYSLLKVVFDCFESFIGNCWGLWTGVNILPENKFTSMMLPCLDQNLPKFSPFFVHLYLTFYHCHTLSILLVSKILNCEKEKATNNSLSDMKFSFFLANSVPHKLGQQQYMNLYEVQYSDASRNVVLWEEFVTSQFFPTHPSELTFCNAILLAL